MFNFSIMLSFYRWESEAERKKLTCPKPQQDVCGRTKDWTHWLFLLLPHCVVFYTDVSTRNNKTGNQLEKSLLHRLDFSLLPQSRIFYMLLIGSGLCWRKSGISSFLTDIYRTSLRLSNAWSFFHFLCL